MDLANTKLYVQALESAGVDLTVLYDDWISIGLSLSSLGEDGRDLFQRVSQFNPEYDPIFSNKKFDDFLKNRNGSITLGTFFQKCHDAGIKPSFSGQSTSKTAQNNSKNKPQKEEEKWLYTVQDILNAPPQETLWSFITKGVNNALVASSEAGKSTLLLNLAIATAREEERYLNWPLTAPKGRTIYVSTEDGIGQLKTRLTTMLKGGESIPDDSILFILDERNLVARLEKILKKKPADLVIIDTWGDLVGGKYDAEYTRKTMSTIKAICIKYDSTPMYVHHTNKVSENIPDKSSVKGAGDFEQACRVVMMLSIYKDHRWLCCVKGNPFADDLKNICYELSYFPESQRFGRTGNEKPRLDIVKELRSENLGRPSTEIDWESIIDTEKYSYTDLVKILRENGIPEPTAKRKIKKAFESSKIKKDGKGLYYAN